MQIFFVHLKQARYVEDIEVNKSKEQFFSEKWQYPVFRVSPWFPYLTLSIYK